MVNKRFILLSFLLTGLFSCEKISNEELELFPIMFLEGAFIGEADTIIAYNEDDSFSYSEETGYVFYPDNNTYHSFYVYRNKDNKGDTKVFTGNVQSFKVLNRSEILPITDQGYEKSIKLSFRNDTLRLYQVKYNGDIFDWEGIRVDWPIED